VNNVRAWVIRAERQCAKYSHCPSNGPEPTEQIFAGFDPALLQVANVELTPVSKLNLAEYSDLHPRHDTRRCARCNPQSPTDVKVGY
jgi:hypothetical protein